MNLEQEISVIEDTPLTISNLFKYKYPVKVGHELYSNIHRYNTIDELFKNNSGMIILIDKGNKVGHFVCLLRKDKTITFFGPYAYTISQILAIMKIKDYSLIELFRRSNYTIIYNKYQYEMKLGNKIETCGLHCTLRLLKFNLSNKQYHKWLKYKNLKPDEIVALLTYL